MKIIQTLVSGSKSVGGICNSIGEEQSKISHNLKKLMECHFVDVKQCGKQRVYSLNRDTIVPLLKLVSKHVEKYCKRVCSKK